MPRYLEYTCQQCGRAFTRPAGYGGKKLYCSKDCQFAARPGCFAPKAQPWNAGKRQYTTHVCEACGVQFTLVKGSAATGRYCSTACAYSQRTAEKHPNWQGGRFVERRDYVNVRVGKKLRRHEHVVVAERALGRQLRKGEVVHHINCNRSDNRPSNLLICTHGYHRLLHTRMSKTLPLPPPE